MVKGIHGGHKFVKRAPNFLVHRYSRHFLHCPLFSLAQKPVIIRMGTNPKPEHTIWNINTKGTIKQTDTSRPKAADFLEVQ